MLNYQRVYPGRRNSCHQPRPGVLLGSWFTKDDDTPSRPWSNWSAASARIWHRHCRPKPHGGARSEQYLRVGGSVEWIFAKKIHWDLCMTLDTGHCWQDIFLWIKHLKIWATRCNKHVDSCHEMHPWKSWLEKELDCTAGSSSVDWMFQPVSNGSGHPATPKKFTSSSVLDLHPPHSHGNSHSDMGSYYTNIIQNLRPYWVKSCSWWLDSTRSQSMVISSPFLMVNKHNNWHHFARPPGLCCSLPESSHQDGRCSLSSHRLDH